MIKYCRYFCWVLIIPAILLSCAGNMEQRKKQAEAARNLGSAYLAENNYPRAYKELTKARNLNPDDPEIYYNFGNLYVKRKDYEAAAKEYETALTLNPDFSTARNNLGFVFLKLKRWDRAVEEFEQLTGGYIYASPHHSLCGLGIAYYNKKEYDLAEKNLKESLNYAPDYVLAMTTLGKTYIATENLTEAVAILKKAVKIAPQLAEPYYYLGESYALQGQKSSAVDAYRKVIDIVPGESLAFEAEEQLSKLKRGY